MAPQTETKAGAGFKAGVKDYRLTYYTPDYQVKETDILSSFPYDSSTWCSRRRMWCSVLQQNLQLVLGLLYGLMV